jgi:hypothetical protein
MFSSVERCPKFQPNAMLIATVPDEILERSRSPGDVWPFKGERTADKNV